MNKITKIKPSIIYQFKITLAEVKPTVWRRIQVPKDYSFWDLHVAIQDAMGWQDYHLHEFNITNPKKKENVLIGIPDDEYDWLRATLPGWETAIADYFTMDNCDANYDYDFGDDWQHRVRLEAIEESQPDLEYPRCVSGARACPPEDIGGPWGYDELLKVINNPKHKDHMRMLEWVGGSFDAERFDPEDVWFDDPMKRWEFSIGAEGDA